MRQSLTYPCVCFQRLFGGVHVLSVAVDFDGVDLAALFPFPDLFWGDGDVEVFVHEGDEFLQSHGVSGLLVCVILFVFGPFWVTVDLCLREVTAAKDFPVQFGCVRVCCHVGDEVWPVVGYVLGEVVGGEVEDVFGGGLAHGFACDFFGGAFFAACDCVEAQEFFDAELSEFCFCLVDVFMADGGVFAWLSTVAYFAEVC